MAVGTLDGSAPVVHLLIVDGHVLLEREGGVALGAGGGAEVLGVLADHVVVELGLGVEAEGADQTLLHGVEVVVQVDFGFFTRLVFF